MHSDRRFDALNKRARATGVTLRQHCADAYRTIVEPPRPAVVVRPARCRVVVCPKCEGEFPSTAMRQVVLDGNPRARVCVRCAKP